MNSRFTLFIINIFVFILASACGFNVSSKGSLFNAKKIVSGIITPFVGSIASSDQSSTGFLISEVNAISCADPVFAKLYKIETDGSIDDSNPLASQQVGTDARYLFDLQALKLSSDNIKVDYIVKAEGCNGDVYKRPVTNFDNTQNIDAKTSVIADVVNANGLVSTKLNEVERKEVDLLIKSMANATTTANALNTLISTSQTSTKFTEIFGASPTVIQDSKPEVTIILPSGALNELATAAYRVNTFHVDPNYSFAYKWKVDGIVKSSSSSLNLIPSANNSGTHQIDVYVGQNDGSGNIDLTKPYFTKTTIVQVNNNIQPVAPSISINASTPSPRNVNNVQIDIATGTGLNNCSTFSHLAFTDSATPPGILQFTIDCSSAGTQTESVNFTSGDGAKTVYLWAIDNAGVISAPKSVNLTMDSLPPTASVNASANLKGGATAVINLSAADLGTGLQTLALYNSFDGGITYSLLSNLATNATSYNWSVPTIDISNAKLKLVATDATGSVTTAYTSLLTIDSTDPAVPSFSVSTGNPTTSSIVSTTLSSCPVDAQKILLTESSIQPTGLEAGWNNCTTTAGAFSISITSDGTHSLYVWSKDIVGHISATSTTQSVVLDTTNPTISSGPAIASSMIKGGTSKNITWSVSDTTTTTIALAYSLDNGSTYTSIATGLSNNGTYSWSAPSVDSTTVKLRLTAIDQVSHTSTVASSNFTIDSTAPVLAVTTPTGPLKGGETITLNYTVTESNSVATLKLAFAADGVTFGADTDLSAGSTSSAWVVNSSNSSTAKLKLTAVDAAGNSGTITSNAFTIDSTAPTAPTLARTSDAISNNPTVTMTVGSCTDIDQILISESNSAPLASDFGWQACSTTAGAITTTVSSSGNHTLYAWAKDAVGNVASSANSIVMNLDQTNPVIGSGPTIASLVAGGSSQSITWTATDANTLTIALEYYDGSSWVALASGLSNTGSYTWASVPSLDINSARVRVTATDPAGNLGFAVSSAFTIDSLAPSISSFTVAGNVTTVSNKNILVSINAIDTLSNITAFCIKQNDNSVPSAGDTCWKNINTVSGMSPALNISLVDYPIQLGNISGVYDLTAFMKDSVGHISALSNSGSGTQSVDKYSITFVANPAPIIGNVLAGNTDSPSDPITPAQQSTPSGSTIYVQWSATDDISLPSNAIKIQYTTNDTTFVDVASNLSNGANGGCTVNAGYTGCYQWTSGSPSNTFIRLKIIASDGDNNASSVSNPLNTGSVNFLAGNTDHGIGGSAVSAIFTSYNEAGYNDYFDDRQLAVTKTGYVFVRSAYDDSILYVDPTSGAVNYLIKKTGTDTGDGGSVFSATLKGTSGLGIDHQDNLLIYESDRVRKVDLHTTPWRITHLFGGGATVSSSSNTLVNATALSISTGKAPGIVTPDGKLYYYNGKTLSYYDYSDTKIHYVSDLNGLGSMTSSGELPGLDTGTCSVTERALGFDISTGVVDKLIARFSPACTGNSNQANIISSFNPITGSTTSPPPPHASWGTNLISSLDGQIYGLWHGRTTIKKYNKTTNTWNTILGTGVAGRCADGTSALSCNGIFMSAFVSSLGTVYFMDMGVVRYIDSSQKVQTMFGQRRDFGVSYSPLSSRISLLNSFALNGDDIYIMNTNERKITKFSLNGGSVSHIAGNSTSGSFTIGSNAITQPMTDTCGWSNSCMIQIDGVNNRLYVARNNVSNTAYVDLTTGLWQQNVISGAPASANFLGINPATNNILAYYGYSSAPGVASATLVNYNYSSLTNTRIYGPSANTATPASNNKTCWDTGTSTQLSSCDGLTRNLAFTQDNSLLTRAPLDTFDSTYKVSTRSNNKIYSVPSSGSSTFTLYATTAVNIISFDIVNDGVTPIIYYCGTDGKLYKRNVNAATETNLPLPLTSMTCSGTSIYYHPTRNSVIFGYRQNLLYGIAEYRNP